MIEKTYQPGAVESRIYEAWEKAGAFRAGRPERAKAEPYCIVIPPPNVTGSLHMGHALNNTLQDILCRFERMRGRDVLWQPGTDHAGIATQAVVERQLMERQESSRAMGREAFIKRVWEWKARIRRHHHRPAQAARRLLRLVARALHHGRGLVARGAESFRRALPRGPHLQGQAAGQLGPEAENRDLRSRSAAGRDQGQSLAHQISDRGQRRIHRRGDDAARDHARRRRGRGASGQRAAETFDRQDRDPAAGRPAHSDHRRRVRRSGKRHRRGQDHAGARLQRFRGRQAA